MRDIRALLWQALNPRKFIGVHIAVFPTKSQFEFGWCVFKKIKRLCEPLFVDVMAILNLCPIASKRQTALKLRPIKSAYEIDVRLSKHSAILEFIPVQAVSMLSFNGVGQQCEFLRWPVDLAPQQKSQSH